LLAKAEVVIEAWQRRYDVVRLRSAFGYRRPAPQAVAWPGLA
jgi:putative transposase